MRFFSKEKVYKNVISDAGIEKKTDSFSIAVILLSNLISVTLVILGVLIFFHS